jgi:hypothetical protein
MSTDRGPARWSQSARPPSSDYGLAPDGHALTLHGAGAACGCGNQLEVSSNWHTGHLPAAAYVYVGAWMRHLEAAGRLDKAGVRDLSRRLRAAAAAEVNR